MAYVKHEDLCGAFKGNFLHDTYLSNFSIFHFYFDSVEQDS